MIVSNKEKSINKANEISTKLLSIISEETKNFECDDDPAEQIYLACHILGSLIARVCITLEGYGKIYAIPNLTNKSINNWITSITTEYLTINDSK